jgi:hypothetical protein
VSLQAQDRSGYTMNAHIWDYEFEYLKKDTEENSFNNLLVDTIVVCSIELKKLTESRDHEIYIFQNILRLEWNINQLLYLYSNIEHYKKWGISVQEWYEDINKMEIDFKLFHKQIACLEGRNVHWILNDFLESGEGETYCKSAFGI